MEKTHVIIFHDKSKKFISKEVFDNIWKLSTSGQDKFKSGENIIAFSSIAKILTTEEFYNQYPQEREAQIATSYKNFNGLGFRGVIANATVKNALESIIKGMESFIESARYQGSKETKELLEFMKLKRGIN